MFTSNPPTSFLTEFKCENQCCGIRKTIDEEALLEQKYFSISFQTDEMMELKWSCIKDKLIKHIKEKKSLSIHSGNEKFFT